jgi:hypothetical protein
MSAVNAVHTSVVYDSSYAPEILMFRFTRWPSLAEQQTLLKTLVKNRQLSPHSSGLLDITALDDKELPDPDSLATGLAQAASNNSVLKRIACVVASPGQTRFVETLRMMAPLPGNIGVFLTQHDALQWLLDRTE